MVEARKNRVLILGGGHAGVRAARRLLKAGRPEDNLEVTVVNHDNVEVFHGLMPQIIGGNAEPDHIVVSLRQILPGITLYTYEVSEIDLANRRAFLDRGDDRGRIELEYDYLVIALGSVTDLSRFPGLIEHGLQTKTFGDIFHIRNHLIDILERASVEQDPEERQRILSIVVAGAGFSGIEIACQANGLIRAALRYYPQIKASEVSVIIISSTPRLLPAVGERLARRAARFMERSGIEIKLGVALSSATATTAILSNGEQIPTRTLIVTVGNRPNPVIAELPVEFQRGRITSDDRCRVPGYPGVYAIGDIAAVPHLRTGEPCPPTALYAFSQGECAGDNILAEIRGRPPRRYRFNTVGSAALLSPNFGLVDVRGVPLPGLIAALIWRAVFFSILPTRRSRLTMITDWIGANIFPPEITQLRVSRSDTIVPLRFGAGEPIIREGEPGDRFYIVTAGEVEVVRKSADGGEESLARLGPGQYFGEVALLHETRRLATVRTTVETTVLSIARQDFGTLVQHMPVLRDTFAHSAQLAITSADKDSGSAMHA